MKIFVILAILALANAGKPKITQEDMDGYFDNFKKEYNRQYLTSEAEQYRRKVFADNVEYIFTHNFEEQFLGAHNYILGINNFTDLTNQEFRALLLSASSRVSSVHKAKEHDIWSEQDLPNSTDWTTKGVVTPVRDQGALGPSWAFAAADTIASAQAIDSGNLVNLSVQNLIDCCKLGKYQCSDTSGAFEFVISEKGLDTEKSYPFSGGPQKCQFNNKTIGAIITGLGYVLNANESDLQDAVANVGPIAVTINASLRSFQFYKGGIYDDPACDPSQLDHDLIVVGYDAQDEKQFWKLKNSWGTGWGEKGYVRLVRNKKNQCGVASIGVYPLVHNDSQIGA